jgi:hypothetical protein
MKTGSSYSEIPIQKGQKELSYQYKIEREDQISGFASWDTTFSVEKTKTGFKLKFAKECPQKDGKLYLNIHSPYHPQKTEPQPPQ